MSNNITPQYGLTPVGRCVQHSGGRGLGEHTQIPKWHSVFMG